MAWNDIKSKACLLSLLLDPTVLLQYWQQMDYPSSLTKIAPNSRLLPVLAVDSPGYGAEFNAAVKVKKTLHTKMQLVLGL